MRLLAHRGAPVESGLPVSAENTVAAVLSGLVSADGVEVDLRLSADGVLVLSHDPDLRRVAGCGLQVAATSWDELRETADAADTALARVEWLLAALAGRPAVLELKPTPTAAAVAPTVDALVRVLLALADAGLPLDVTVSSFSPAMVAAMRRHAPAWVRTALLGRPTDRPSAVLRAALAAGHDAVHPYVGALLAEPGTVRTAHACGVEVVPWTVNRGRVLRRFAALGVDAVITDVPAAARQGLAARRAPAA